jgi:hypothetical protein
MALMSANRPYSLRSAFAGAAVWLLLALLVGDESFGASGPRYEALLADGRRLEGDELTGWETTEGRPLLNGQPLLAEDNPFVWLRDRSLSPAAPPTAFVETICGDVLPGEVVDFREAGNLNLAGMPEHFLVRPHDDLRLQATSDDVLIRVIARFVRRIVFARRSRGTYEPSTVFYRDGRSAKFRGARFSGEGVSLLLAEGPVRVSFRELAEIHLPATDPWEAMLDELAVLSTDGRSRLLQFETTAGLTVTASLARLAATVRGNPRDPARWVHGVQPAWSLDVLWVYNGDISVRRSFAPGEVPLTRLFPSTTEQHSALGGSGFLPVMGRNVRGGPLHGGSLQGVEDEFGWGVGVHALSRLHFPLSKLVRAFRTHVGIDAAAGSGGCVRARVLLVEDGKPTRPPLFESGYLLGGQAAVDTGELQIPESKARERELVLEIDPAHEGRPAGADPLDIRDLADWLDPRLLLDEERVAAEIERRGASQFEAWQDWTVEVDDDGKLLWSTFWDETEAPAAFRVGAVAVEQPFAIRRRMEIGPGDNWLILLVSRTSGGNDGPRIEITIDGEPAGEYEIPRRDGGNPFPSPVLVPLAPYQRGPDDEPRQADVRILQTVGPASNPVVWRSIQTAETLPTLFPVFEDKAALAAIDPESGGEATLHEADAHSGAASLRVTPAARFRIAFKDKIEIRRDPKWGQFLHLRFAFRKFGAGRVSLELEHENSAERPLRFDAGLGDPSHGQARRVWTNRLPAEWIVITKNLVDEFGEVDITGVVVSVPDDEYALFDHIYFGRTLDDLEKIPALATADDANARARREALRPLLAAVRPAVVSIDFGDGRFALGTIVSREGEILSAGHLVLGPGREANVTLADGRRVKAKTLGVSRAQDLGLLKIDEEGDWPLLPLTGEEDLPAIKTYVAADVRREDVRREDVDAPDELELKTTRIRRVFRGAVWTDLDAEDALAGGPLSDGRLLGVYYRRSRFGGFLFSRIGKDDPALGRMRGGEVWGDWQPGTGPVLEIAGTPVPEGLKVMGVTGGSRAETAGLAADDVIVRCEGTSIVSFADFDKLVEEKNPGEEVRLELLRGGEMIEIRVQLAPRLP